MKPISILILNILIVSCINTGRPTNTQSNQDTETSIKRNSPFYEDNFEIIPRDNWSITQEADTFNSYQFKDLDKQIFYRINVLNHSSDLTSLGIKSFDERYLDNYFKEYILNLQRDKWDFHKGTFINRPAVFCDLFITNDLLADKKEALSKIKMVTLLNGNKSYILSVICKPELIDSVFTSFINSFRFIANPLENSSNDSSPLGQNLNSTNVKTALQKHEEKLKHYKSLTFNYQISIPSGYSIKESYNSNIDFKVVKPDGSSILIDVTKRQPQEYNITAHDYTKENFEDLFKNSSPNLRISKAVKYYIDNNKAFLIYYSNLENLTKVIEVYFYKGDHAFVLTATTSNINFLDYENVFLKTFQSMKFD